MLLELRWSMVWRTRLHQGGIWINNELSTAWSAEGAEKRSQTGSADSVHGQGTHEEHSQRTQTGLSVFRQFYGTILAAQPPPGASLTFNLVVLLTCVLVIL